MPSNIEIKVRTHSLEAITAAVEGIADGPCEDLHQVDTFFHVPNGRLKLREINGEQAELIHYHRPDTSEARQSDYRILIVDDPSALIAMLHDALGVRCVVRKHRILYMVGQTRVHLDSVEGLGTFVELEYVLKEGEPRSNGDRVVKELAQTIGLDTAGHVAGAYADLLEAKRL